MSLMRRVAALTIAVAATTAGGGSIPRRASAAPLPRLPAATRGPAAAAQAVRPAQISGSLRTPDRRPLRSAAVIIRPLSPRGAVPTAPRDVEILPDGRFTFRSVLPGRYQIRACADAETGRAPHIPLFAVLTIDVDGRDITNLDIVMAPGAAIAGTIALDAAHGATVSLAGARVRAPFADDLGADDSPVTEINPDGTFEIRALRAGVRYLAVDGLPEPWVLKRVVYRGRDITGLPLRLGPGDLVRDLRLTITDRVTRVNGTVRDERGSPVADALVIVLPPSSAHWTRGSRRFRTVRTDAAGRYEIPGLPPGEYFAVASIHLEERDAYRREAIDPLLAAAVPFAVAEDSVRALDLAICPVPGRRSPPR